MVAKQEADKRAEEQLLGVRPVDLVEAAAPTKVPHGAAAARAAKWFRSRGTSSRSVESRRALEMSVTFLACGPWTWLAPPRADRRPLPFPPKSADAVV